MNLRLLLILATAPVLSGAGLFAAQPKETIETADGSVYMGHTSVQYLDKGTFDFMYDSATVVRPRADLVKFSPMEMSLAAVQDSWKNWFAAHPEYVRSDADGNKSVVLHRLNDNDMSADVVLLSQSPDKIKYFIIVNGKISPRNSEVRRTVYGRRDPSELTGLVTEITTRDGRIVRGELVEVGDEGQGIFTEDCIVEYVPSSNIASLRRLPLKPDYNLVNQVEYLDELQLSTPVEGKDLHIGVIAGINYYTDGRPDPYVILHDPEQPEDSGTKIPMNKLVRKSPVLNKVYMPQYELIPEAFSYYVNASEVPETECKFDKEKYKINDNNLQLPQFRVGIGDFVVNYLQSAYNSRVELMRIELNKKMEFSLENAETFPTYEHSVSRNDVVRNTYLSLAPGTYALHNKILGKFYLFEVVPGF